MVSQVSAGRWRGGVGNSSLATKEGEYPRPNMASFESIDIKKKREVLSNSKKIGKCCGIGHCVNGYCRHVRGNVIHANFVDRGLEQ